MGSAKTDSNNRRRLRRELEAEGWAPERIEAHMQRLARKQAERRAALGADNRVAQHGEARRKLRRRLEAESIPQHLIDKAVKRLAARQAAARRAGVTVNGLDELHNETHAARRLDDTGYKPTSPDALARGPARVTPTTLRAARRTKATTKYEHDRQDTG